MTLQEIIDEVYEKHDAECLRLTKQRDEARREVCELSSRDSGELDLYASNKEAKRRGWDCYKETP
jgi:hypothetical protein